MSDEQKQTGSSNISYADAGVLHYRLDTSKVLDSVENFLRAKTNVIINDGEQIKVESVSVEGAEPLLNNLGVQAVMCRLNLILNSQVVQGYWERKEFWQFIGKLRKSLALTLMENKYTYGIPDNATYNLIIDGIIECLTGVLSRLIDNKERESYGMIKQVSESIKQKSQFNWRGQQQTGGV